MKNTVKITAIILVAIFLSVVGVYAVQNLLTSHSTKSPSYTPTIAVKVSGSTVSSGSDLTSDWTWTGSAFTMTITVYNTGSSPFQPTVDLLEPPQLAADWILSTTWNQSLGGLNSIAAGNSEAITIIVTPPDTVPGTSLTGNIAVNSITSIPNSNNNEWTCTQTFTVPSS